MVAADAKQVQDSPLEQPENNVKTADAAEQKLEDRAPGTRIDIKGKTRIPIDTPSGQNGVHCPRKG
jgi:hypothetical protein